MNAVASGKVDTVAALFIDRRKLPQVLLLQASVQGQSRPDAAGTSAVGKPAGGQDLALQQPWKAGSVTLTKSDGSW